MSLDTMIPWSASGAAALLLLGMTAETSKRPEPSATVHDFRVRAMDGREVPLSEFAGQWLLVVNTASRCGFTPQYAGLEKLHQRFRARGLRVLAFPANDFMRQEPGSDAEIRQFCSLEYGVTFPVFSKLHVKGRDMHPLFEHLTEHSAKPGPVRWNFSKFLVDPQGRVVERFDPRTDPLDDSVIRAIESRLPAQ